MIRKPTWIVLLIFFVLAAAVWWVEKNPPAALSGPVTPSPTPQTVVLAGWNEGDIVAVTLQENGSQTALSKTESGGWQIAQAGGQAIPVEAGVALQLTTQLMDLRITSTLPADYPASALGLSSPARMLTLRTQSGQQAEIRIGSETPTQAGDYLQFNDKTPVVVEKSVIDGIFTQWKALLPTPTPDPSAAAATPTP